MKLQSYIDLQALLKDDISTQAERRTFGLTHVTIKNDPVAQLLAWTAEYRNKLSKPFYGDRFESILYHITLILVMIAFVLGLFSGIGLLSYSGKEPVNLVYFLAMVVFLPLLTMTLTLVSMLWIRRAKNILVHISPAFWMEKLLLFFSKKADIDLTRFKINPLLANWIVIKRSQMLALSFSLGLFVALLGIVATKDIAFAWSTTLNISSEHFHQFLNILAFPWRNWLPSAVPSLDLIEQSHYFRLGGELNERMVAQAVLLGTWWKFLAMATLFYAIILRFFLYLLSTWGLKKAFKRALLTLEGARELLKDMNEPLITTYANKEEMRKRGRHGKYDRKVEQLDASYDVVQGWAISQKALVTICDTLSLISPDCYETGGNNTLDEDREIIHRSHGEVVLFVKAWEPPTMDFIDYLELLADRVEKVVVVPIGTAKDVYAVSDKQIDIWVRKLAELDHERVWIKV
ncbi:DUF2868 domain-containing protein [Sulfurovum sp. ST-21]|uniref:DUF2868 domain-containing protein n=1 Tax=Sulfurovum indicum TaxID=2779528 RepID=A0A7M1S296_9BACT|nr:DUF2868 domain-containing protein [Sulfurovum indicum]QOR61456.1 DUF2868 domain-containing protein [Sulfurovum indicum]